MALRERSADGPGVWVKRLDTGPRSRLTDDDADERWPVWRPSTDDVTFVSTRDGSFDVDARRFLMARQVESAIQPADEATPVVRAVLVNNFVEELRAKVPVRR